MSIIITGKIQKVSAFLYQCSDTNPEFGDGYFLTVALSILWSFPVRVKQHDKELTHDHVLYVSESVIGKVPSKAIAKSLSKDLNSLPEEVKLFTHQDQGDDLF